MKIIILILTLSITVNWLHAKDYYLSSNGNDSNSGRNPEYSWQTIEKLNTVKLKPGDNVYFKSGEVFTGSLLVKGSGTPGKPITFASYGTGKKPVLTGAVPIAKWERLNDSIWFASIPLPVTGLY